MLNFKLLFLSFFRKGKNSLIKIMSLSVGLALGLVLIAKVYFERSYDNFYPDTNRIYRVQLLFETLEGKDNEPYSKVSGAVPVGMAEMIPEVVAATRYTWIQSGENVFFTNDRKKITAHAILADTSLFDIFPRPMLAGNAKEILGRPMYAMVSRTIAKNMGGVSQAVGRTIWFDSYPDKPVTINGVFEDVPANSHMNYDLVISMNSISEFMYDGSLNWVGNERYNGYIKVIPGANPASFGQSIQAMKDKYLPLDELVKAGVSIDYNFLPLLQVHAGTGEIKRMVLLLSLLAFALLFTAIMNYVLIVISSIVNRSKEMAVYKCYGASENSIRNRMLMETLTDLIVSLAIAVLLILFFRGMIYDLLNTSIKDLFGWESCLFLVGVCLIVYLVSGLIPGYIFGRIPVAVAFRNFTENRRKWKLTMLFVQFVATGLLVTMLVFIVRQYDYMISDNPGYEYESSAYCELSGVEPNMRQKAVEEVARLSGVEAVTTFTTLPFYGTGGNNIGLPDDNRELFNIADLYYVGNDYLQIMGIPVVEGRSFLENVSNSDEVMVSRSFINKILPHTGWTDGVVGKSITVTQHSSEHKSHTICGVYEDFRLGSIGAQDPRPTVMFYDQQRAPYLMIKFHKLTSEGMLQVSKVLTGLMPIKDINLYTFSSEIVNCYRDSRQFRDQVMIGGTVALIICMIGLIGYTRDEIGRRRREIAIRKVNGATISNILNLFSGSITKIALPALILGNIGAYFILKKWLEQFPDQVELSLIIFLCSALFVQIIILLALCANCYKAAIENPANSMKTE